MALRRHLHAWLSTHVVHRGYAAYRLLRPAHRHAMIAHRMGLRLRSSAISWSNDERCEWILRQLRRTARRANTVPFWSARFKSVGFDPMDQFSFEDFARLPALEREEVREAGLLLRVSDIPLTAMRHDSTGGSTGVPTEIWTGPEERGWRESGIAYSLARLGLSSGARTARFWGHHLDPVARDSLRDRLKDSLMNVRWFDCLRLSPAVLQQYHEILERWRPDCIIAYAGALASLAEELERLGIRPNYPARALVTGAEKLHAHQRAAVERVFSRPVNERYGSRDVGLMAFQSGAPEDLQFEVDWANVLLEPETVSQSAGVLVTKLHADAMPMLRYRVGDIARFPSEDRPGHPTLRLSEVLGRDTDRIWLRDGSWVHGIEYPHMMKDYPIREFQVHQDADYHVVVRVVPSGDFPQERRDQLLRTIADNLPGLTPDLEFVESISRTPANKWRPVVTEVKPPFRRLREQ